MHATDGVRIEKEDSVALIVLDRPQARNAMNFALASATCEAIEACQDAGAIVITGVDPSFCAGLDLRDLGVGSIRDLPPFTATVAKSVVPVIAAVNGPAVTGGFELALAADFIVASDRASFADTHLRVGVYPGPVLVDLPRRVGGAWAREISLTGNFIDATTALRIGIANHVVAHDELIPFCLGLARAIAEADHSMVSAMRRDWDETVGTPVGEARRIHGDYIQRGKYRESATGGGIAAHRDTVLERSREQRKST